MSAAIITDVEYRETVQDQNNSVDSKTTCVSLLEKKDPQPKLAAAIVAELERAKAGAESAVAAAIRVGDLLLEAKEQVPHGHFQNWLTTHCHLSVRHAQRYLSLAKKAKTIEPGDNALAGAASMASAVRALTFKESENSGKRTVFVSKREPREAVLLAFNNAWRVLKRLEKDFQWSSKIDCKQARKKLIDALELIDSLEADQ